MPIIRVALDVPLSTLFDYVVETNTVVIPGQRVLDDNGVDLLLGGDVPAGALAHEDAQRRKFLAREHQMTKFSVVYGPIFGLEFGPILDP